MTDNRFQHIPSGNKNINTIIQPPAAAEAIQPSSMPVLQKFMFEFGSDGNVYSVSFFGNLSHEDIQRMLESVRQKLYADCGMAIHSYLDQNNISYSGFKTGMYSLSHQVIMDRANRLLQSCAPEDFNVLISRSDNYYAVMDQQVLTPDGECEGCYYAVRKSADNGNFYYRIVGQTFSCNKSSDNLHGYFAVRTGGCGRKFHNSDAVSGEPVFPAFGCIDIMGVLIDIDSITTSRQAKETALR